MHRDLISFFFFKKKKNLALDLSKIQNFGSVTTAGKFPVIAAGH